MKKILQVVTSLNGGGAERIALNLDQAFHELGHIAKIVVFDERRDYEPSEEQKEHIVLLEAPASLGSFVETEGFDAVIAHMEPVHKAVWGLQHPSVFYVVHNTQSLKYKSKGPITKFKRRRTLQNLYRDKHVVTVSHGVKEDLLSKVKIKAGAITVIENPFDITHIQQLANAEGFTPPSDRNFLLHVGSFNGVKRHDVLIKAFSKLAHTDVDLYLLGKGSNEKKTWKLVEDLGLSTRVFFLGWQNNPYAWMKHARMLVLSSDVEGLPSVLIEALITGTPPVSTRCKSGPDEIMIDELADFLSPPGNPAKLAENIDRMIEHPVTISDKYYARYESHAVAQRYVDLIR